MPEPLKTLLLSLAVSDLGVGLLGEPFYVEILVKWLPRKNSSGASYTAFRFTLYPFSSASFFGVMALKGDRFLAVYLHLSRVPGTCDSQAVCCCYNHNMGVQYIFFPLLYLWVSTNISHIVFVISGIACLVVSAMLYFKIYFAVRRHRIQIRALQVQQVAQNDQIANADRLRKSAVGVFYVYLVFLLGFLPHADM